MVAVVLGWLRRRAKNQKQTLVGLGLGLLLMLVAVFSAMCGGEENKGEMRTKTLVYDADPYGKIGLYWMDDKSNMSKATPEEVQRCEKLRPNGVMPDCQITYYEKDKK